MPPLYRRWAVASTSLPSWVHRLEWPLSPTEAANPQPWCVRFYLATCSLPAHVVGTWDSRPVRDASCI